MNLTFRQFEILAAAADGPTFSAAAHRLGISQPSFSESIRRIERETGLNLFERTTRSLKITKDGRELAGVAREVMKDFRRALERVKTGGGQGRIAIAALPSITCAALPRALMQIGKRFPGIEVAVHDVQHERAMAMLRDRIVDMAVTIKPARGEGLTFEAIAADTAHLVCRSDHPLARKKEVRWRELSGHPFIGITAISSVRRLTDAGFVHGEVSIEPRYEVEQVPCAVALVEAGLGITALPSLTFAMFKGRKLATRPLKEPVLRRNVGFVTLSERNLPGFVAPLKDGIREILKETLKPHAEERR